MASFCGNCGSPLRPDSTFCVQCGSPVGQRPNPVAPPSFQPNAAPVAPARKSSAALKIVLVLVCCLALGGAAVIGGLFYVAHRVKKAVVEEAAKNGVDLSSLSRSDRASVSRRLPKACDLLAKEDVSRLIGEPIERAEPQNEMCFYYGPPGLSAKLAQDQASGTMHRASAPGAEVNPTEITNSMDQLVNSLGAQAGQTGTNGEYPLLMLGIDADGRTQMTAVRATKAIFSGIGKDAKGLNFGADVPNLGDSAVRVPKLGLNVLQGGVLIRIIPGPFPDADAKTIAVARAVLPKI